MWGCKCYIADRPLRFCPCGGDASRGTEAGMEAEGEGDRKKGWGIGSIMSSSRAPQNVTIALLSYLSYMFSWPGTFQSVGSIGGWSCSELIGGESSGGSIGGCRYAANSASVSSCGIICWWKNMGESSDDGGSIGGWM